LTLARTRGELEKRLAAENIKVEWVGPFDRCAPLLQAITARSADIGLCGDIAVISGLAADMPLCAAAVRLPVTQAEAILVRNDSPIKTVQDLVGKKVAANTGGWGQHLTLKTLDAAKVPRDKVELVNLTPTDALPALLQGKVDAWTVWDPFVSLGELDHNLRRIASGDAAPHYLFYPVYQDLATQEPELVKKVVAAIGEEGGWVTNNPDQAAGIYAKELKISEKAAKQTVDGKPEKLSNFTPEVISTVQASADWMLEQQIIKKRVDFASKVCPTAIAN
jgi:sulfonate transport system substrate-binding protein